MSATRRHRLMKENATTILESSTVVPFKWHRQNYLCFYCHRSFKEIAKLIEHSKQEHRDARVKAAVDYLRRDERAKIDVSQLSCSICDTNLDSLTSLIGHLEEKHEKSFSGLDYGVVPYLLQKESFNCALCDASFDYFIKLNQHMNTHYGNYVCELCGKAFLSRERLRCHSTSHGLRHRCSTCTDTFSTLSQRIVHERKAHNKRRVKCLHCSETFTSYASRKTHHSIAHGTDLPAISCPVCQKTFNIASKMRAHLKEVHLREKNFACSMCDQRFFSKSHVQKHMVRHVGERVHQCSVCNKSYARKQTLRDHMRIHNDDRRFSCEVCGQAFVQNNSLRLHNRVHHPEEAKNAKTKTETSSMRRRRNLQMIFNNSSAIPFKWRGRYLCFYCSKDLAEYTELRRHTDEHGDCNIYDHSLKALKGGQNMEIKVDVSNLSCKLCGNLQSTLEDFLKHLDEKHNMEYDRSVEMAIEEYRLADLKCLSCEATFNYFGYLVSHVNSNHPKNCLICDNCDQRFNKKRDLFSHIKNYHRVGGYTCDVCPMSFASLNILRKHRSNRHLTRCEICQLKLPSAVLKQRHIEMEHPDDGSLQCDNCSKEFHTKQGLKMHARKCKGLDLKQEPDIDDNFTETPIRPSVKRIRENIVIVINMSTAIPFNFYKNKFNCFYCSMDFNDSDSMRAHTISEHPVCDVRQKCIRKCRESVACVKIDISELSCKVCSSPMDSFDGLIEHLISTHNSDYDRSITGCLQPFSLSTDNIPCPQCSEEFRFFSTLLKHINSEHSSNRLICAHCGRVFGREQNLRVHIWRHHASGRFTCSSCSIDCKTPSSLYAHMAKLHGVRTAKCSECSETFATQHSRQRHLIDAHNLGHRCNICGKLFTRASFARDHAMRTHLKVKDVICAVCGAKFFNSALLRRHMKRHGTESEVLDGFRCVCGERFKWRRGLRAHLRHCEGPREGI